MIVQAPPLSDPKIAISQNEALACLAHLESPRVPTFYECGIIETSVGYYQLGRLENGVRILIFALNMEDLQLREYPAYGRLFAHPGIVYGVNAYDDSVSETEIYNNLIDHQLGLIRVLREEYTLARTNEKTYQSRAASYLLKETKNDIAIDAFIHSLHGKKYAPVFEGHAKRLYDRMRVSRIPLNVGHIDPKDSVFYVLRHFSDQLNKLAEGKEGIQDEDTRLSRWSRARLRLKMYGVRFIDNLAHAAQKTWGEIKEKKPEVFVDLLTRIVALTKLPELIFVKLPALVIKDLAELPGSLWDAFNISPFIEAQQKIPERLKPYINESRLSTRLNPYLYHLDSTSTETMVPLNAEQANIAPPNVSVTAGNPFEVSKDRIPDIGALRAPLGTVLHKYGDTTLIMQANGVWMAMNPTSKKTYVGYNRKLDTDSKPTPPPVLKAWLGSERVICYTHEGNDHSAVTMEWKQAAHDLQDIIAGGDAHLIAAHAPAHDHGPHLLPMHGRLDMRYLDFSSILEERNPQPVVATGLKPKVAPVPIDHPKRRHLRTHAARTAHTLAHGNAA